MNEELGDANRMEYCEIVDKEVCACADGSFTTCSFYDIKNEVCKKQQLAVCRVLEDLKEDKKED